MSKKRQTAVDRSTQRGEPHQAPDTRSLTIVAIGASAGGLEALQELFRELSPGTGMAFVVITHQHPEHPSMLAELLSRETDMPVENAVDGCRLAPDHVYVATPGCQLAMLDGRLQQIEFDPSQLPHLPIDSFFRSLATDQGAHAIGIVLSGTGSDGTLGIRAIKGADGIAIAQDPGSARYAGMPSSAIATSLVDFVLPPAAIAVQLKSQLRDGLLIRSDRQAAPSMADTTLQRILLLLRNRTGHDFSGYKTNTLNRRIERRMIVHQIHEPERYVHHLQENPHELDILFKELLIGVTSFFRDPDAWDALGTALRERLQSSPAEDGIRVWVAGCNTGEEAYSISILLSECLQQLGMHRETQIFGTDIDEDAVMTARAGCYPEGIALDLGPERLQRNFKLEDHCYRIRPAIRESVVFAAHNVIKDPPFTRLDLVICRNLLIYMDTDLQRKLLPVFHYVMKPDALLFLGTAESVGNFSELFRTVDQRWKIFRRTGAKLGVLPEMPSRVSSPAIAHAPGQLSPPRVNSLVEHLLLERFAPASIVANSRGDIIYIHGRTGAYLEPAAGQPRNNLLEMAREGLRLELALAIRKVSADGKPVTRDYVRTQGDGTINPTQLTVVRLEEPEPLRGMLLVSFCPSSADGPAEAAEKAPDSAVEGGGRVKALEAELVYLRDSQQTTTEELETSNEELRSANEELQSTNEELQSTNEELETSREELQSLNEELSTVNAELQSKVDELSQTSDDMQNLLNSTKIATVFLDDQLRIKRYTAQARELILVRPGDIGRPINELACTLQHTLLQQDCRRVLDELLPYETEVCSERGSHYLMRILPYRTSANVVDGLVLTFVDINRLKNAQKNLQAMSRLFMAASEPMLILDLSGSIIDLNEAAAQCLQQDREALLTRNILDLLPAQQAQRMCSDLQCCSADKGSRSGAYTLLASERQSVAVGITMRTLCDEQDKPEAIALTLDATDTDEEAR